MLISTAFWGFFYEKEKKISRSQESGIPYKTLVLPKYMANWIGWKNSTSGFEISGDQNDNFTESQEVESLLR